jgi:hypothetical protein
LNIAHVVVENIIQDMKDRHGFKDLWDSLDEEIMDEICNVWIDIVEMNIKYCLFKDL